MNILQRLDIAMLRLQVECKLRSLHDVTTPAYRQMRGWYVMLEAVHAEEAAKVSLAQAQNPHMNWV